MPTVTGKPVGNSLLVILCPQCRRRLPLSGEICMSGTVGLFCRGCRRTIQITVNLADVAEGKSTGEHDI